MNWRLDQMKLIYLYIKYTDTESYKALGKKEKKKTRKKSFAASL